MEELEKQIEELERQLKTELKAHPQAQQLKNLPGVGRYFRRHPLSGDRRRGAFCFGCALSQLCGFGAGRARQWGRVFHGPTSKRSNHYLRWALVEAANLAAARRKSHPQRHISRLYERLRPGKGTSESSRCHGTPSGRIRLVDFEETTTLSRAAAGCGREVFVPRTGKRVISV